MVEDERRLAQVIQQALEEEGHVTELAFDGEEGFDLASSGSYDLVVLDWMLPKLSGPDLARSLRREKVPTPILMLTARDAVADRVEGLDAGADDYLVKPFAFQELFARVRALSRRKVEPGQATRLEAGKLVLDLESRRAFLDATPIDLTPKEFALLEYLMRNQGAVRTRDQIADHVWGYLSDVTGNVVDLYIHYLRTKLKRRGGEGLIQTVRGVGYSLRSA
ncbi:MAG: response regulator transcription factor [Dehalococcoidia bacterium]